MKTLLLTLCALCLCGQAFAQSTYTNLITYQTVNGSVTGGVTSVTFQVPVQTLLLLSGNITNAPTYTTNVVSGVTNVVNNALTNILTVSQFSLNNANWTSWATNTPDNTNGVPTTATLVGSITAYFRTVQTTPNPLSVGVLKQN
jgi:hypothetical protein